MICWISSHVEKKCKKIIRKCRRQHELRLAESNDINGFSSYVKSKRKQRDPVGPLKVGGKTIKSDLEMSSILNEYFTSVFTREDLTSVPECLPLNRGSYIHTTYITPNRVEKAIRTLKPTTSCGPSDYTNKFLIEYCSSLINPLAILFNKSIKHNSVPDAWKIANIGPIFVLLSK